MKKNRKEEEHEAIGTIVIGIIFFVVIGMTALFVLGQLLNEQETQSMRLLELDTGSYNLQNVTLRYVTPKACFASNGCRSVLELTGQQLGSGARILCSISKEYELNGKLVFYCYRG